MIIRYLSDYGYTNSAVMLEDESGISLKKWDVCDNVDLYYVLKDYEEYHQIKFGKPLRLVKKVGDEDSNPKLPTIPQKPPLSAKSSKPPVSKDDSKIANKELKKTVTKTQSTDSGKNSTLERAPSLSLVFSIYKKK